MIKAKHKRNTDGNRRHHQEAAAKDGDVIRAKGREIFNYTTKYYCSVLQSPLFRPAFQEGMSRFNKEKLKKVKEQTATFLHPSYYIGGCLLEMISFLYLRSIL